MMVWVLRLPHPAVGPRFGAFRETPRGLERGPVERARQQPAGVLEVATHGSLGAGAVAAEYRGDDRLVLGADLGQGPSGGRGGRPEQRGRGAEPVDDRGRPLVAPGPHEAVVQVVVSDPEPLLVARPAARHRVEGGPDRGVLVVRGVLGGAAGGGRLEGEADVDDLLDVAGPRDDDLEARGCG